MPLFAISALFDYLEADDFSYAIWPKANEVRLSLHALAYGLGTLLRTKALPNSITHRSMTSLRDRKIKIGTKAVRHAPSIILQLAEVAVPRDL